MAGIFDYIAWWGDLDFHASPFNPVDNIILTHLAYFPFDRIVGGPDEKKGLTIAAAAKKAAVILKRNPCAFKDVLVFRDDPALLADLGRSRRFGGLELRGYVNQIDPEAQKQFSAVTITGCEGTALLSYRGTDNTIVGWKEDFNMSFTEVVPAQLEAVSYLEKTASRIPGPLRLGGHSKGGNLAVYAAAFCQKNIRRRIRAVYSNDAPGFNRRVLESPGYLEVKDRIHSFVPQSAIVGMLFEHGENYTVVKSNQTAFMQHDVFSWEVGRDDVVRVQEISQGGDFVNHTLREWIDGMDGEHRRRFADALYEILSSAETGTLRKLGDDWLKSASLMIKGYQGIDGPTKKLIAKTVSAFFKAARNNLNLLFPAPRQGPAPNPVSKQAPGQRRGSRAGML
ncbi:MAG: DUF2974 domain-containing protein [Treponema sp.]|jgi:hypothetical protein|nr:DUF2974 domain-containing protein [Treponema sp.]